MNGLVEVSNSVYKKEFIQLSDEIGLILNGEGIDDFTENDISKYLSNLEKIQEELKKEYRIILDENKELIYSVRDIEIKNSQITKNGIKIRNFINKLKVNFTNNKQLIISQYIDLMNMYKILEYLSIYIESINNEEIKAALNEMGTSYFNNLIQKNNSLIHLLNINKLLDFPYIEDIIIDGKSVNIYDSAGENCDMFEKI